MRFSEVIRQAFEDLKANRLRSFLTLFGIIWGIMAIMILLGWGFGFRDLMWEGMSKIGEDLVVFTPGHTAGHCGFYEMNSKIAFFGDMDLTRFPYYATIDSNLMDFERSIEKLKGIDIEIAILGHRDPVFGRNNIQKELDNFLLCNSSNFFCCLVGDL